MSNSQVFPLQVVGNTCLGAAELRERLLASGLDTPAIARLVRCHPLALVRATKTGSTPRGMLIGLATLLAVVDHVADRGINVADLIADPYPHRGILAELADESPLAARMVERLRDVPAPAPATQLAFDVRARHAA